MLGLAKEENMKEKGTREKTRDRYGDERCLFISISVFEISTAGTNCLFFITQSI